MDEISIQKSSLWWWGGKFSSMPNLFAKKKKNDKLLIGSLIDLNYYRFRKRIESVQYSKYLKQGHSYWGLGLQTLPAQDLWSYNIWDRQLFSSQPGGGDPKEVASVAISFAPASLLSLALSRGREYSCLSWKLPMKQLYDSLSQMVKLKCFQEIKPRLTVNPEVIIGGSFNKQSSHPALKPPSCSPTEVKTCQPGARDPPWFGSTCLSGFPLWKQNQSFFLLPL